MEDTRRFIIFIAVSVAILIGWQYFYAMPKREAALKQMQEQKEPEVANIAKPGKDEPPLIKERSQAITEDNNSRVKISNGSLHGSIPLKGTIFDDITLVNFRQQLAKDSPEVYLYSPRDTKEVYFADFNWLSTDNTVTVPNSDTVWSADNNTLNADGKVIFTWDNGQGIVFKKIVTVDKDYMFTVTQAVENNSGKDISLAPYGLISRAQKLHAAIAISHEGPIGVFNDVLEEVDYSKLKEGKVEFSDTTGWLGIADKYWLSALVPNGKFNATFSHTEKNQQHRFQVDFLAPATVVKPGEKSEISQKMFVGAKKIDLLDKYKDQYSIPLFDRAVDFGYLYFLTRPLFYALKTFNAMLGNFGLAILLLTVVVKLLLFPLANKSYKSMAKLKKHMPELMELQKRYKGDKVKLSQETMKFYKENGVNPASGCLPVLIQIPVFFALYKVLYISIEMRHAPFYGWIHDLSAPDYTNIFNLFGLIAWTPPTWLPAIGILPIVFGLSMFIQQRLSPPPTDPTQATIMKFLPLVFVFILAQMPAGLIVYWIWSNIISILQQLIITRKVEEDEDGGKTPTVSKKA